MINCGTQWKTLFKSQSDGITSAVEALRLRPSLLLSCVSGNPATTDSLVALSASPLLLRPCFSPFENVLQDPVARTRPLVTECQASAVTATLSGCFPGFLQGTIAAHGDAVQEVHLHHRRPDSCLHAGSCTCLLQMMLACWLRPPWLECLRQLWCCCSPTLRTTLIRNGAHVMVHIQSGQLGPGSSDALKSLWDEMRLTRYVPVWLGTACSVPLMTRASKHLQRPQSAGDLFLLC